MFHRLHARGRDLHYDAVRDEQAEDYPIISRPATPLPQTIIKATDDRGRQLRQVEAHHQAAPLPSAVLPEFQEEMRARERTHNAILDVMAEYPRSDR